MSCRLHLRARGKGSEDRPCSEKHSAWEGAPSHKPQGRPQGPKRPWGGKDKITSHPCFLPLHFPQVSLLLFLISPARTYSILSFSSPFSSLLAPVPCWWGWGRKRGERKGREITVLITSQWVQAQCQVQHNCQAAFKGPSKEPPPLQEACQLPHSSQSSPGSYQASSEGPS